MLKLSSLDFAALNLSGANYLAWALDAKFWLKSKGLGDTITQGNNRSEQHKAQAMTLLRHHLHESLKNEYLTVEDPVVLWSDLKERYEHQKTVILPRARYDWVQLRLQDYKSVSEYNSALHLIASKLALCGEKVTEEDKLEKTFSTFHANNVLLQTQYREKGFTRYSQLISCLLVAEEQNQLLLKNHGLRPTGSAPLPEANTASFGRKEHNSANNYGRGRGYQRGRGRGRGRRHEYGRGRGVSFKNSSKKWTGNKQEKSPSVCHRCGGDDHWAKRCRTPKHLVDLYQQSLKQKGKKVEANLVFEDGEEDFGHDGVTHMETSDFLEE
ncbi:uncharacterized protein LOC111830709 [Capsella rubella]|uniref:uncharacterized protein LOC111830709 n=2 Tax=Capsella rubella TaxID=81985 RepID=UPI000CD56A93|nr:uncharacterized protein LOC111830709 [Capsella rubella]